MAQIDTSTIDGFDSMSAEEKVTALLGVEIPESVDLTGYVKKDVFDAKAKEAAALSKQLKSTSNSAESANSELATIKAEFEEMKRNYYVASKGLTGDDAEFIAFKATKMVDDKTTFEQAVDSLTKEKKKQQFDWTAPTGRQENKQSVNDQMNALIRKAFK